MPTAFLNNNTTPSKTTANKAVCNQLAAASIRFIRAAKKAKRK